jgi:hypothetical protein
MSPENIIKILAMLTSIMLFLTGLFISNVVNDVTKSAKDENQKMSDIGSLLYNIGYYTMLILIIALIVLFVIPMTRAAIMNPDMRNTLIKFSYLIGAMIILLLIFMLFGWYILSYNKDTTIDDETKNDKYAMLGQWLSSLGLVSGLVIFFKL